MRFTTVLVLAVLLSQRVGAGTVIIASAPRGASVTVDGRALGKAPLRAQLTTGLHDLEVAAAGYETHTERLEVQTMLLQHVVTLRPKTYPVDVVLADLGQEGWAIYNGTRLVLTKEGKIATAPATIRLPKGSHKLRVMKSGFRDIGATVEVGPTPAGVPEKSALVEIATTPKKGYSSLGRCKQALVVGTWYKLAGNKLVTIIISADGKWVDGWTAQVPFKPVARGSYKIAEGTKTDLTLFVGDRQWAVQKFTRAGANQMVGRWQMFRTKPVVPSTK